MIWHRYMWICRFTAEAPQGKRRVYDSFPSKELQDYWSTRPKYEDVDLESGDFVSGSSSRAGDGDGRSSSQSYQEWLAQQKESKEEPPPPPYSLEEDEATQPTTTTALSSLASAAAAPTKGSRPAMCSELPVINTVNWPAKETLLFIHGEVFPVHHFGCSAWRTRAEMRVGDNVAVDNLIQLYVLNRFAFKHKSHIMKRA